jgi:hypothetical protein
MVVSYQKHNETRYRVEVDGHVVDDCRGRGYTSEVAAQQGFGRQVSSARQLLIKNPDIIKRSFESVVEGALSSDDRLGLLSAMLDGLGLTKEEKEGFVSWYTERLYGVKQ